MGFGLVIQEELIMQARVWKMLAHPRSDALEIASDLPFFDDAEPALHVLAHDFAKFLFLLRRKKEFGRVNRWSLERGTALAADR